jgi:hypothetical protein
LTVDLAVEAGALALDMQRGLGPANAKSPIDFCTEADRAVERLIRDRVSETRGTIAGFDHCGPSSTTISVRYPTVVCQMFGFWFRSVRSINNMPLAQLAADLHRRRS